MSNRVSRRQANRWADQEAAQQQQYAQAAPPPAPAPSSDDTLDKLKELAQLKEAGVLTDAEFEAQKAKILAGM